MGAETRQAVTIMPPAPYIILDTETADAPDVAIAEAIAAWKAPSNWKPETVEAKRAEYAEKARDKAALLDASPIICVGLRTPSIGLMFSGMGKGYLDAIPGWAGVIEADDEAGMLEALRGWLNTLSNADTCLVGHNCRGFDLPKLRSAFVRHRQPLPDCLRPVTAGPGQPISDTMHLFKHFSMEHRDSLYISLDTACRSFGIARPKAIVDGSMVPEMYRAGRYAEILTYCAIDIDSTAELYRLMMT